MDNLALENLINSFGFITMSFDNTTLALEIAPGLLLWVATATFKMVVTASDGEFEATDEFNIYFNSPTTPP